VRNGLTLILAFSCENGGVDDVGDTLPLPAECDDIGAIVESGPAVSCVDPGARSAAHFERTQSVPQPALTQALLTSAGIVVADFTGDGRLDTFLPHIVRSDLWVPNEDGTLVEEAASRLPGIDLAAAVGGTAVDIEGDGDFDLFVTRCAGEGCDCIEEECDDTDPSLSHTPSLLLRNDGTGHFTDVTSLAGLDRYAWRSQSSSWADYDNDGDLDVFVGSYGPKPEETYNSPDIPPSEDDSQLWRNEGDGTFTDMSSMLPAQVHDGWVFMSSWIDLDLDGYPELFTWHDFGTSHPSTLMKNEGGAALVPVVAQTQIDAAFEDMGVAFGDLNHDGLPDFATTSFQKTRLLLSQKTTEPTSAAGVYWVESSDAWGLDVDPVNRGQAYGWGAEFGDLDHDRDDDLAMVFGFWSTYDGGSDPPKQYDGLWVQHEATFENLAAEPTWAMNDPGVSRGLLMVDVNEDGFLDVIKRELDTAAIRYISQCDDSAWLKVELQQEGANRHAIGARITAVSPDGFEQTRWIHSGSASMYSGGPPIAHFGLAADDVVSLRVVWPDGAESEICEVETRRTVTITRDL
jgi:hypothetical protein